MSLHMLIIILRCSTYSLDIPEICWFFENSVAWFLTQLVYTPQAWHLVTSTFTLRGKRGTWWHPPSLCVAGVALTALGGLWWHSGFPWSPRRLAWQAWHLVTSTFTLRGRRGTWWHPPSFHVAGMAVTALVAGVALGDIHLRFTWQAWHLVPPAFVSRGRRGAWWHRPSLCVAGVALAALGWLSHHLSYTALSHSIFDTLSYTIFNTPLVTHRFVTHPFVTYHLCHTPSFTHHFVTHHLLPHHFVTHHLSHTHNFHKPSFTHHLSHHFVTHHLSHTICHTPSFTHLCHTPSFTHNFVTHHLSHHFVTHHLSHTALSDTIFHKQSFINPAATFCQRAWPGSRLHNAAAASAVREQDRLCCRPSKALLAFEAPRRPSPAGTERSLPHHALAPSHRSGYAPGAKTSAQKAHMPARLPGTGIGWPEKKHALAWDFPASTTQEDTGAGRMPGHSGQTPSPVAEAVLPGQSALANTARTRLQSRHPASPSPRLPPGRRWLLLLADDTFSP